MIKKPPGIIPALDTNMRKSLTIASILSHMPDYITALKIGSLLVMENGLRKVCKSLAEKSDIPVILDMQKGCTDIPQIVEKQIIKAAQAGVTGYIGSPMGAGSNKGPLGTFEVFVSACKKYGVIPIVVLEMTHPGSNYFLKSDAGERIAKCVCELEVPYVVAPANLPERIEVYRQIFLKHGVKVEILSPGVGPQKTGDPSKDAVQAVKAGADHVIVGRAIYTSEEPAKVVKSIYKGILKAFQERL